MQCPGEHPESTANMSAFQPFSDTLVNVYVDLVVFTRIAGTS